MLESGAIRVSFEGEHFNKRELLRIIKALKIEHRNSIKEFRKKSRTEKLDNKNLEKENLEKETENANTRRDTSGTGSSERTSNHDSDTVIRTNIKVDANAGTTKTRLSEGTVVKASTS